MFETYNIAVCWAQVDGVLVSQIGPGLLCLVGISDGDTDPEAGAYM